MTRKRDNHVNEKLTAFDLGYKKDYRQKLQLPQLARLHLATGRVMSALMLLGETEIQASIMKYMGSKNRIAKHILPIMLKDRAEGQYWVEPFVGGANMIDKVVGNRIGADFNKHLIDALKLIRDSPQSIPNLITEDDYKKAQNRKKTDIDGFIGFAMSFGGKWFGGYRRDRAGTKGCIENMATQTRRSKASAIKQSGMINGVDLVFSSYSDLKIPPKSIIYCDPPYEGTTGYKDKFDHAEFWQWCRDRSKEGHTVFISEYNAPDDFECIWQQWLNVSVAKNGKHKKAIEKLFTIKSEHYEELV